MGGFNVMIQLCKITRASKLFQRNFYLPLLKPLSPKDALRKYIITGKDVMGRKLEHYIPVLEEYEARRLRRKYIIKGKGKKRQRKKQSMKYMMPFFDEDMDNHTRLQALLNRKGRGRGQCYTYHVPEKNLTLVFTHQMERAIRDKDIVDVTIAQKHDKIIVKLKDGMKIYVPIVSYDGRAPFYRGEGWTRREIEEFHHFGRETMSIAKIFEAKESGVEEWELEMMRMASKRKKKQKGEGTQDWKAMMQQTAESVNWDEFEEESKQIVEEQHDPVEDDPIAMEVDDMEKTKDVNEKLKVGGTVMMEKLPLMPEIPELIKVMQQGEMTEMFCVSGIKVNLPSNKKERFVPGQMVSSDDGDIFMPGQTVENDDGEFEYTPGFTVLLEDEPTLIPGLVMGNDPNKPMFLPGESTITETGELQFTETDDDRPRGPTPPPGPDVEEVELEEEQNSEEEEEEKRPPPKREKKEFIYERPKRMYASESMGPKRRERGPRKPVLPEVEIEPARVIVPIEPVLFDLTLPTFEKDLIEQEKQRVSEFSEKKAKEEVTIDKRRREIKLKAKQLVESKPPTPKYQAQEPVKKSEKLKEFEKNIKKGSFFDVDYKKYLNKERGQRFNWLEPAEYRNTFDSVGMRRHRVWKSVY
ncbi:unnamed protein product [Brassicogethes aeneus]|uniref:Uncharacterized protein n=1 Tax=Brassicogethes aeneus TaxID=1431903 RepID=A0A9P0B128_BRAAE|nr:unnamed protein product [Brassicogethes aeneus]